MNTDILFENLQEIPFVNVKNSSLGGHMTTFVHLSLDDKESWANKIFHNSRYAIFSIADGKVELLSKGLGMPKFRKSKAETEEKVVEKIIKYCQSV